MSLESENTTPLINGKRHAWASIRFPLFGRTVTGIMAIKYDDKTQKSNNYGMGNMPVSRGDGNYEATASVTLAKYEVEAIQSVLPPGKRLQDIPPFDIPVVFLPEGQDTLKTDVLCNVEFTGNKRDMKQGDSKFDVELELILSHINWAQ